MKRAILFLCVVCISFSVNAQVNFAFPDSAAIWVQYYETMIEPPPLPVFIWQSIENFCVDGSDTLISGLSYTKLSHCGGGYQGGLRSTNGQVYYYPPDSIQEYLLYDFAANPGDTLYDVYVNEELGVGGSGWVGSDLFDLVVVSSSPDPTFGGRIRVEVQMTNGTGIPSFWIEGIGCYDGLFTFNPVNVSNYWYGIHCMSHKDTILWNHGYVQEPGNCAPQYIGVDEPLAEAMIAIQPNPSRDVVHIVLNNGVFDSAWLVDLAGRAVPITVPAGATSIQVDLSTLEDGIYFICLQQGEHTYKRRLLKG